MSQTTDDRFKNNVFSYKPTSFEVCIHKFLTSPFLFHQRAKQPLPSNPSTTKVFSAHESIIIAVTAYLARPKTAPEALNSRMESMSRDRSRSIPINSVHQIPRFYPINRDVPLHERAHNMPRSNLDLPLQNPKDTRLEEEIRQERECVEERNAREVADAFHHREEWPPVFYKLPLAAKNYLISKWDPRFKDEICFILRCCQDTVDEHLKRVKRPHATFTRQEGKDRHWQAIAAIDDGTMRRMFASLERRSIARGSRSLSQWVDFWKLLLMWETYH